jgi:aminoglycoside 6'-N-acetyltransferase
VGFHPEVTGVSVRGMETPRGTHVRLRPAGAADVDVIVAIRAVPEVCARWGGDDLRSEFLDDLASDDPHLSVIEDPSVSVVGAIRYGEDMDPDHRPAAIDIDLHPAVHGHGYGTDAVRTLARHPFEDRGHHRLAIDPAANNVAAIRCCARVGFPPGRRPPPVRTHRGRLLA